MCVLQVFFSIRGPTILFYEIQLLLILLYKITKAYNPLEDTLATIQRVEVHSLAVAKYANGNTVISQ